ncbi:uncharacterized protein LOC143615338 [Bidens hawaiensis]|uniref:uncharacterized protein LOC143615338 n=1 Tax=Bidens hawaiensis TaxID=980011 RepID=UPI00404B3384
MCELFKSYYHSYLKLGPANCAGRAGSAQGSEQVHPLCFLTVASGGSRGGGSSSGGGVVGGDSDGVPTTSSATWPLDGMKFDTLKEQKAKRTPEDYETGYGEEYESVHDEDYESERDDQIDSEPEASIDDKMLVKYESDINEPYATSESDVEDETPEETVPADVGTGWGRIIFSPMKRG